MRKLPVFALSGALAVALTATAASPLTAAPIHLAPSLNSMSGTAHVEEVQFRHRGHHRHHHRGHRHGGRNAWLALGIGSAIAGGLIASQPYGYGAPYAYGAPVYGGPAYASSSSGWERCQAEFRSLRADGTYTTYGGEQKLCPYLR